MATVNIDPAEIADIIGVAQQCDYAKGKKLVGGVVEAAMYDMNEQFPDPNGADHDDLYEFVYEVADGAVVYTMDNYNVVFFAGDDAEDVEDFGARTFDEMVQSIAAWTLESYIITAAREAGYDV